MKTAADPDALVIGIDANAAGLHDGFRRAYKAKLGNALLVVAAAEALPAGLAGTASEVRIQFLGGSLLTASSEPSPRLIVILRPTDVTQAAVVITCVCGH